ncbi:MAG: hypothetical protein AAFV77_06520, partial [Planctomycetota bacterium]
MTERAREWFDGVSVFKRGEANQPAPTPEGMEPGSELDVWFDEIQDLLDRLGTASEAHSCDLGLRRQDGPRWNLSIS